MPRIVGLVSRMPRPQAEAALARMVGALRRDSRDHTGSFGDQQLGLYVAWSEHDGPIADRMPLGNARGDRLLVFSGEDYSGPGAPPLRERGDDPAFPAALNGQFHGLLIDRSRDTATLFNDRYGIHRLYYHQAKDALYFSAEAKAILAVCPALRSIDAQALGEFVACGCVLENRTLFSGIHVLPPASSWLIRQGAVEFKDVYFEPREWEEQPLLALEEWYTRLREVFATSLPRYFPGGERIGMSLTGGLDTRLIMAWQKRLSGSLPCYSFGGMFRRSHDVRIAEQIATACGQSHQVIPVDGAFLSRFAEYAEQAVYRTDGCASARHAADLWVNERAAQIAPIRMTGNYGGEVLRRVRAFKPVEPAPGLLAPELIPHVRAATPTYERLLHGHPLSFALFRQLPWHHFGLLALEQTELPVRSPFLDNDIVRTLYSAPASAMTSDAVSLRLIGDGNPALLRISTDRGAGGGRSGARSLISRSARVLSFKAEYACDYGMPQWLARLNHMIGTGRVERTFLGRHKFSHFRVWYRDNLSEYVRQMLLDPRTLARPYLQRRSVEAMVHHHLCGDRNYTADIHLMLTLELVHRLFLDPHPGAHESGSNAEPNLAAHV